MTGSLAAAVHGPAPTYYSTPGISQLFVVAPGIAAVVRDRLSSAAQPK